ncbi:hypothetical protein MUK42_36658 [Musa troglodytarum]|uniref:Uncharacterized protein n=1 Tax=Musa troglodytarum TaxID=320322 RepID=A0A9E7G7E4_9LILI|nr:hypothetical protein MUK42_36658 [Musa troglodytarum]
MVAIYHPIRDKDLAIFTGGADKGSMADHALMFPFPVQGRVNSMLKLAELLSLASLDGTFINTDTTTT